MAAGAHDGPPARRARRRLRRTWRCDAAPVLEFFRPPAHPTRMRTPKGSLFSKPSRLEGRRRPVVGCRYAVAPPSMASLGARRRLSCSKSLKSCGPTFDEEPLIQAVLG